MQSAIYLCNIKLPTNQKGLKMILETMNISARWNMTVCTKNMLHVTKDFKAAKRLTSHALAAICVALNAFKNAKSSEIFTEKDESDFEACCDEYTKLTGFVLSTRTTMRQAVVMHYGPAAAQVYEYLLALGYNAQTSDFWGHFLNTINSINVVQEVETIDFNI